MSSGSTNNGDDDDEDYKPPFYKKEKGTSSTQQAPSEQQQFPGAFENISRDRRESVSLTDRSSTATPSPGHPVSDYSPVTDQTSNSHLSSTQESSNLPGFGFDSDATFSVSSLGTSRDAPSYLHSTLDSSYPNLSSHPEDSLSTGLSSASLSLSFEDLTVYAHDTGSHQFSEYFSSTLASSSSYPYNTGTSDYLPSSNSPVYSFDDNPPGYSSSDASNTYFKY
ncbi:hypothetical protein V8F33_007318 [Rhypophila sp. PSN 637]